MRAVTLLPLTLPGIAAGATLVFCVAVSAYVTPALMGPSGARYAPVIVYQQFISAFNWPRGTAIASVLLIVTALMVIAFLLHVAASSLDCAGPA